MKKRINTAINAPTKIRTDRIGPKMYGDFAEFLCLIFRYTIDQT